MSDRRKIFAAALIGGVVLVGGLTTLTRSDEAPQRPSGSTNTTSPRGHSECPIDPSGGEAAIIAAISSCPDGTVSAPTVVRFPAGKSYAQANRIEVRDRNNLVIDGNGSTFTTTANGCTTKSVNGNWVLIRGTNITLKNMTAVGSFNIPGPRNLTIQSADPCYTEATMNYGVYGTDGVWLVDVKGFNAWGDAVTVGPAHYAVTEVYRDDDFADDVHINRMEARKSSRHCWAPTSGVGTWIEDSTCTDAWYAALDAETDYQDQPLRDHHYLRNTFDGFSVGGLLIPVPGQTGSAGDIEIRGNKFLTTPDVECNPTVLLGGYPEIGPKYEFSNVIVEDNEFHTYARAINLDRVKGGVVRNNRITQRIPSTGATILQHCGEDRQIIVTNSTGVVVEGGP